MSEAIVAALIVSALNTSAVIISIVLNNRQLDRLGARINERFDAVDRQFAQFEARSKEAFREK